MNTSLAIAESTPPAVFRGTVRDRWGVAADTGWTAIPYILLLNQSRLKLTSEDINVLLNLLAHWHARDRMPFPRTKTIAARMGVTERSVQRSMKRLIEKGYVAKEYRKRYTAQRYDVNPLVYVLQKLSEEKLQIGFQIEMTDEVETPPQLAQLTEAF
jgi:predicted transcriptional regulator